MASNNPSSPSSSPLSHDDIGRRARELWESRGQPSGQDEAIWLEAERELTRQSASPASSQSGTSHRRAGSSRSSSRSQRGDTSESGGAERTARENSMREPNFEPGD